MKILNRIGLCCGFLFLTACQSSQEDTYGKPSIEEIEHACGAKTLKEEALYDLPYAEYRVHGSDLKQGKPFLAIKDFEQIVHDQNLGQRIQSIGAEGLYSLHSPQQLLAGLTLEYNRQEKINLVSIGIPENFNDFKNNQSIKSEILQVVKMIVPDLQNTQIYDQLLLNYQQALQNKQYDHQTGIVSVSIVEQGWKFNLIGSNQRYIEQLIRQGKLDKFVDCESKSYILFQENLFFSFVKM